MPHVRAQFSPHVRPLMLALLSAGCVSAALADVLPTGMVRVAGQGQATVNDNTSTLSITQQTPRAVWEAGSFSVGAKSTVDIRADSANSLTLVRVVGAEPSALNGRITSNNSFLLINPWGIQVGSTANISTANLLLSARDLDSSQIAGGYKAFIGGTALVFNTGTLQGGAGAGLVDIAKGAQLTVGPGGAIVLLGDPGVRNQGRLNTGLGGSVSLVAAGSATVNVGDSGFIELSNYAEQDATTRRVVFNEGSISAPNGQVLLAAAGSGVGVDPFDIALTAAAPAPTTGGVSNSGSVLAQGSQGGQGQVRLVAKGRNGNVAQLGVVDVSALDATSRAGQITLSAQNILASGQSVLRADGPSGGGRITLDNLAGASGETVSTILVDSNALLSADATESGAGGAIVVSTKQAGAPNSYGQVAVFGNLQARGGPKGGQGGTVDTSADLVVTQQSDTSTDTLKQAHIDVSARSAGAAGGLWTLYSPQLTVGPDASAPTNPDALFGIDSTYVNTTTLNGVLDTGASVSLSTYLSTQASASGTLTVLTGTRIRRSEGTGRSSLTLQSGQDLIMEDSSRITSVAGPLDVTLTADAGAAGSGRLVLDGNESGIDIVTQGGHVTLTGTQTPAEGTSTANLPEGAGADINGLTVNTAGVGGTRGDITITGTDGGLRDAAIFAVQAAARAQATARATAQSSTRATAQATAAAANQVAPQASGVNLINSDLSGRDITITGHSSAATAVSVADTRIATDQGRITITGVAEGGGTAGQMTGVAIGGGVSIDAGQGRVTILGRAVGGALADTIGLRITDLTFTTPGNGAAPALITLAGQSVGSSAPGVFVDGDGAGIQLHDALGATLASNAQVIIGGSADASAPLAMVLGKPALNTTGGVNFRPLGVSASGQLQEAHATAIRMSSEAASGLTNFIVRPEWFVPQQLHTVIGSNGHTGLISVADGALDDAGAVTLQNQGAGAQGIELGSQSGEALALSLLSNGNVNQSGPLQVAALNVLVGPQAQATLNNSGNAIGSLSLDSSTQTTVSGQAVPASVSSAVVLGFDSTSAAGTAGASAVGNFETVAITNQPGSQRLPDIPKPFEGPEALRDLRTDVYVRGQLGRPLLCTAASTSATAGIEADLAPLAQEWVKVRHSAQLTSCSGVRTDSSCAAF
jgi:filamentous hemagglutinin family protein